MGQFFQTPNRVRAGDANTDARLAARVDVDATLSIFPWDDGSSMCWYVVCAANRFEQITEELLAHVGINQTDYRGQRTVMDLNDEGDLRIQQVAAGREVMRVNLLNDSTRAKVGDALRRMLDLWSIRPTETGTRRRPMNHVLAEYRLALHAGCRSDAEHAIAELRSSGALEVTNIHYLELELRSVFDGPTAVLAHPRLHSLLGIRRPARVTDILARAVDQEHLQIDASVDERLLRRRFAVIDSRLQQLITAPGECRSPSGALLLALRYRDEGRAPMQVLESLPTGLILDSISEQLIEDLDRSLELSSSDTANGGAGHPAHMVGFDSDASLTELLALGEYDRILEVASAAPEVTFEILDASLRAAQWLDSIESARQTLAILEAAAPQTRERFTSNRLVAPMVDALRGLLVSDAPRPEVANWNDFFENLERDSMWRAAVETAEHGVLEWPVEEFVRDPAAVAKLVTLIGNASDGQAAVFRQIVPLLIEWLGRAPDATYGALLDVHEALLAYLSLQDETRAGLAILGEFASNLIESGLSADRYAFCMENLEARWNTSHSPAAVGWAAEILECLIDNPCPDPVRRDALAGSLLREISLIFHRVDESLQALVRLLARELALESWLPEQPTLIDSTGDPTPVLDASGVVIGLYSLTPGALHRAKETLERKWKGLTVKTRSDKAASDELASLARNADAMIIAWLSAKHQATECIETSRGSANPPLRAEGKGSASLIRVAESFLFARV